MSYQMTTKRGYDFFECSSAMQKAIRRGDTKIAGYFAQELFASGYHNYVWKRLLTVSAEDVELPITTEIIALHQGFEIVNKPKKDVVKGRIFISKAVILLCRAAKSRDMDHLQCLVYDLKLGITDAVVEQALLDAPDYVEIPDYSFDVHTKRGKMRGATKKQFFEEERNALLPIDDQRQLFDQELQAYINGI